MRNVLAGALALVGLVSVAAAEPLAKVGSKTIERAAVEKAVAAKLAELERERYDALREGLDELVAQSLMDQEAAARGVSVAALVKEEIEDKAGKPTDEEIQALYEAAKDQLGGAPLAEVRDRLVEYIEQQKVLERRSEYVEELKKKYPTTISLRPPMVKVGTGSRAGRGGEKAAVTIVEFSDYECPYCRRVEPTVQKVLSTYGDKVRFYYRDYPLPFHAQAQPAAEAAHCANAQGKFWAYHDKLMASDDLEPATLKTLAGEVGLDQAKFDKCVDEKQFAQAVAADYADGEKAGVNGTPAFFINGRMIDGAQPFENFQKVIDEELAWAGQKK